ASIMGMTAAAKVALAEITLGREGLRQHNLREKLWQGIQMIYPMAVRHGDPQQTLPNTLNVHFPKTDGETLIIALDLEGIAVSSGSACMVGSIQASHVLQAMGVPSHEAQAAVRFSLGRQTTEADIKGTVTALEKVLKKQHSTT
ncbi:MAG: aminotransferase class V-fold PLP-dependent enzyme, partial [Chthoniobacterales bacterium]|nr:aminotransferase class V-fold PLP-dependent enzyme [Chthoniobacterales bacterium]